MSNQPTPAERIEGFIVGGIAALIFIFGVYLFLVHPGR